MSSGRQPPIRAGRRRDPITGRMNTVPFQTNSVTAVRTPTAIRVSIFGLADGGVHEIHSPDGAAWTVGSL